MTMGDASGGERPPNLADGVREMMRDPAAHDAERVRNETQRSAKRRREGVLAGSFVTIAEIMQGHDATERLRLLNALAAWWSVPARYGHLD